MLLFLIVGFAGDSPRGNLNKRYFNKSAYKLYIYIYTYIYVYIYIYSFYVCIYADANKYIDILLYYYYNYISSLYDSHDSPAVGRPHATFKWTRVGPPPPPGGPPPQPNGQVLGVPGPCTTWGGRAPNPSRLEAAEPSTFQEGVGRGGGGGGGGASHHERRGWWQEGSARGGGVAATARLPKHTQMQNSPMSSTPYYA